MRGSIRVFDAADGLGWIDLVDGRAVRFGLSACRGFVPAPGLTVEVDQVKDLRGVLRASAVTATFEAVDLEEDVWPAPITEHAQERRYVDGVERELRIRYRTFERDPRSWPADFTGRAYSPAGAWASPPEPHPFFAPWHDRIVASAVGTVALTPALDGTAGRFGGEFATIARAWPSCATHGRMALVISVEPATMAMVIAANRLTLHVCLDCLDRDEQAWAGAGAAVEWSTGGTLKSALATQPPFPGLALAAKPALSFPPAWLFGPRRDVEGHHPIAGIPAGTLDVGLHATGRYEAARFAYDRHYPADDADVVIGGYSDHGFGICATCISPLRQVLAIRDYFSEGRGLADVFHGNRRLRLLACDRTPACGGIERGLVVSEP